MRRLRLPGSEDPGSRGFPRPNRKVSYLLLAGLVLVALVRGLSGSGGDAKAPLVTSCTTVGFALEKAQVQHGATITMYLTGPTDRRYAGYLDITALTRSGTQVVPTTRNGVPVADTEQLFPAVRLGSSCRATRSVTLTAAVPVGEHVVTLFSIDTDGSGTALLSRSLTVTQH